MCLWYFERSSTKKVMEGRGGVRGSLVTHCVECSHFLLHCTRAGMDRGILFQGWFCIIGGMGFVEIELELECVQDNVGVKLEVDEVAVEHVAGVVETVGAKDRAGIGWFKNPSLLVEGRLGEDASCSICS